MADTIPVRVQHKRMTAAQWRASSVVLLAGELGVESDTGFVKVGDGTNRFSALKYLTGPAGPQGAPGRDGVQGPKGADGVMRFEDLTPQQKASLKGEKGDKGDPGPKGADGARGSMGLQGAKGDPGQSILNSRTNQALKYWAGSKADYDRIGTKDTSTIYDVWE